MRLFGLKREEVAGGWRRLHNELLNLYASSNIIGEVKLRMARWAGHVVRTGKITNAYEVLVGKPEWKRPLERLRQIWEDNIRMDLKEVGWEVVHWMHLDPNRDQWWVLVNTVMNLRLA